MSKRIITILLLIAIFFGATMAHAPQSDATAAPITTNVELAKKLKDVATKYKTLYVMGGWGAPLTEANKKRFIDAQSYNQSPDRKAMINAASSDTFAFDCVCLIKGLLWGWDGDLNAPNGGAVYGSNGVPDKNADEMFYACSDISTDFSNIEVGELVWMPGHVGIYIGDGLAVEATPIWDNCVQITACNRNISGYNTRNWTKHGKLPYVKYMTEGTINSSLTNRSDGVWFFPLPKKYYNAFTDWAGCNGANSCYFHPGNNHGGCAAAHETKNGYGHAGFDIGAETGVSVYAMADGIAYVKEQSARGKYVVIEHRAGTDSEGISWSYYTYYQHLSAVSVSNGTPVKAGQTIGKVGSTGYSTGSHLHLGMVLGHSGNCDAIASLENKGWITTNDFKEGRILVNPALDSPAGFPTGDKDVVPNLKAHPGSVKYTFDTAAVNIGTSSYIDKCSNLYPSYGEATVKTACNPHPLPCSHGVALQYGTESRPMTDKALSPGDKFTINGIIKNTEGHYWYKVTLKDGTQGYVYAEECKTMTRRNPSVSGSITPDSMNGATYLGGTVQANGAKLNSIQALVYKGKTASGSAVIKSNVDKISTTGSYKLEKSAVDYSLPFQDLAKHGAGYYTITIEANVTNYYLDKNFKLQESTTTVTVGTDVFAYGNPGGCTHSYSQKITQPTCNSKGYTTYTCSKCGDSYKGNEVDALGHNYSGVTIAPTCTHKGYTSYACTRCGNTYLADEVAATGHSYKDWYRITNPTCTQEGAERRECRDCEAMEERALSATGHSYTSQKIEPTCKEQGYTYYHCAYCGHSYTDNYVDTKEHSFGDWTIEKAPTCVQNGIRSRTCTQCSGTQYQTMAMANHNYSTKVTQPTCTQKGYTTYTCTVCGQSYRDNETAATGHSYSSWKEVKAPTCTEKGTERRDCKCGHYETRDKAAAGHSYGNWYESKAPGCTTKGQERRDCKCGHYETRDKAATGHGYGNWYESKAPGCTTKGQERRDCKCGHYETRDKAATGHSYGNWYESKAPGCATKGEEKRDCKCGSSETREKAAKGHSYKAVVTEPTCTAGGFTTHTCSACGNSYKDTEVAAKGHSYGNWTEVQAPTCTAKGQERRDCKCGHYETREKGALGHNYVALVTDPTCTDHGFTTHTCSRCNDAYVDTEVAAKGHAYDAVVTEPTCGDAGYTTHTCSSCGDSYADSVVAAKGHSFGEWSETLAPTCTEAGINSRNCAACGYVENRDIDAKGHTFTVYVSDENATCTEDGTRSAQCDNGCGQTDSQIITDSKTGHSFGQWYTEKEATETEEGRERRDCVDCGHSEYKAILALGQPSEPTNPDKPQDDEKDNEEESDGSLWLIVGVGCVCVVGALAGGIIIGKRKRA